MIRGRIEGRSTMPRRAKGLTAAQVEKGAKLGRYGDGAGLYLLVRSREAKFWLFRYTRRGKMREMGLGPAAGRAAVSLSAARAKARQLHAAVREGKDPLAEREAEKAKAQADTAKAKAAAMTFGEVADMHIAAHETSWRSPKHRQQWRNTLRDYVVPAIGHLPVGSVDTGALVKIIEPLWREKTETASRVRGRIESILDYAKARGWREGENPARWRGHLDQLLPKRSKVQRVAHHAALPWRETGAFLQRLRQNSGLGARCLEFLILAACRSGEVRGARWDEIDLVHKVWTIPAERIKAGREHRVPLSEPAMAVLHEMAQLGNEGFVFPGLKAASALSDVALAKAVAAAGGNGATVHGFRSTFRDWCAETTNYPRELAEAALAHALKDKTEAAYQRGDLLEKRRRLMADWAAFCSKPTISGEVVTLHVVG
jgi:integrase